MIKLLKYLRKRDVAYLVAAVGLIICQVWLDLTMPDYTSKLTAAVASGNVQMKDVFENGGMMLLCAAGTLICACLCGYLCATVAASFAKNVREKLFTSVLAFSDAETNKFSTPSLITRTSNDVVQTQMFLAMGLQVLIKAPVLAIWAICKISSASMEWTWATAVCVAVIVVCVGLIVFLCYPKFKQIQKLTDELNDVTRENVSGVRVIRAFNAEDLREEKFENVNKSVVKNQLFTSRATGLMNPIMSLGMNGLTLAVYWIGAYLINDAALPDKAAVFGNMTAFTQYALQVVMAFMMLIMIFIILPRTLVCAKRINEVLDTKPSIQSGTFDGQSRLKGVIEYKDVNFSFDNGSENALTDINLKIESGQTVAIIGSTGSGKTSLINLIPRFYDVTGGELLVDGINVKDYDETALRDKISVAPQKAVLFKGDIRHNVAYGVADEEISDEKVKFALSVAKADFVNDLEKGIYSEVAQGGTNFSGGQKQRLSIARAVYKSAEIVIFDDSFSALDYKTDMLVRKAVREELKDSTVIIVAQRIGTVMNADKIIVLDSGKIAGAGTHDELMQNCAIYKEIALSQLSKEELA